MDMTPAILLALFCLLVGMRLGFTVENDTDRMYNDTYEICTESLARDKDCVLVGMTFKVVEK